MATSFIPRLNSMHVILRYDFKDHLKKEPNCKYRPLYFGKRWLERGDLSKESNLTRNLFISV